MELIAIIRLLRQRDQVVKLRQRPLVQFCQLLKRNQIFVGVKITDIAKDIARGIADLSVNLGKFLKNIAGNADIGMLVGRCNPQA